MPDTPDTLPTPLPPGARDPWPEFLKTFARVGLDSFGGPVAQLGVMHALAVDERKWLTDAQFVRLLDFANVLPGPEALEVAIHLGFLRRGVAGGLAAGLLFALPGVVSLSLLAWAYVSFGHVGWIEAVLSGVRPVGLALVAASAVRLAGRSLVDVPITLVCAAAFVASYVFAVPFLWLLAGAGVVGIALGRRAPSGNRMDRWRSALFVAVVASVVLRLSFVSAPAPAPISRTQVTHTATLTELAVVNLEAALVTFGGAYTVLPFLREEFARVHGWVTDGETIDAMAFAETTPGPLISVGVFLSFLAGSWWGAIVGALCLFAPAFVFVLGLAPQLEKVERLPYARDVLQGVSGATLGLILAMSAEVAPSLVRGGFEAVVAVAAVVAVSRWKWRPVLVVVIGAAAGGLRMLAP